MRTRKWPSLLFAAIAVFCFTSCQDWGQWDDPSGNQKNPPPEPPTVDASYANVASPTIAKDGEFYYIISSNATIDGIEPQKGLMVRKSANFSSFEGMTDENAYVLSDVLDNWAAARIKELDAGVQEEAIKIGQPSLRKVGNEWRLYYSVTGGSNASVIGYAVAQSADGPWEDKGEILASETTSTFMAYAPSFFTSADGNNHYMAYGKGAEGIYITELDKTTGKPTGTAKQVAGRTGKQLVENATVFYYDGFYHLIFTYFTADNVYCTAHVAATEPMGNYTDVAGRSAIFSDQWAITRVLNDHFLLGGDTWTNVNGVDVIVEGDAGFVVHQAQVGTGDPVLHIRQLHWVKDSRRAQRPELPVPAISPEQYRGPVVQPTITPADIAGDWYYGTLWAHYVPGINDGPKVFKEDGTYSGGTWDFNTGTNILHLKSTEWGGEEVYLYLYMETDNINGEYALVASGYNDTFGDHPGAWMKKDGGISGGDTDEHRKGIYSPALAKENNLFWIISGNAESESGKYEKGLLVQTSDDMAFFDEAGFALSNVIDSWAAAKLRELDPEIAEDAEFIIDQPSLRKTGNKWVLFYSVTATGSDAAVIGYGEASTLGTNWTDKGIVLQSSKENEYRAVSPSICEGPDGIYMAFGEGNEASGIYVSRLKADFTIDTDPVRVLRFYNADGTLHNSELIYHAGKYRLFVNNNGMYNYEYSSTQATGPYMSRGKGEGDLQGMYANGRTMTPYIFANETEWSKLGGIKLFNDGNKVLIAHQAATGSKDPELHVREAVWLSVQDNNIESPFLSVSPYKYDEGVPSRKVTATDLAGTEWNYGTMFRHEPISQMSTHIVLNADNTLGGEILGIWQFNEDTQTVSMVVSSWGAGERISMHILWAADEAAKTILAGTGINADFDKTGVWMKQINANW